MRLVAVFILCVASLLPMLAAAAEKAFRWEASIDLQARAPLAQKIPASIYSALDGSIALSEAAQGKPFLIADKKRDARGMQAGSYFWLPNTRIHFYPLGTGRQGRIAFRGVQVWLFTDMPNHSMVVVVEGRFPRPSLKGEVSLSHRPRKRNLSIPAGQSITETMVER